MIVSRVSVAGCRVSQRLIIPSTVMSAVTEQTLTLQPAPSSSSPPSSSRLSDCLPRILLLLCPQRPPPALCFRQVRSRMEAVGNIKKITKAMKMVASAKLRRCEEALKMTRAFTAGIADLWGPEEPAVPPGQDANKVPAASAASQPEGGAEGGKAVVPNSVMVLAVTPDRGLCGSVSATVFRATRNRVKTLQNAGKTVMLLAYGEKARAALERGFSSVFAASVTEHTKLRRRTFKQSTMMANVLLQQPFEQAEVFYNIFKNMISFETRHMKLPSPQQAVADNAKLLEPYEVEGEAETMDNLYQFSLAVRLHGWLAESDMVEFSQRVNSMGNSSKSAEDMLSRLRLIYNRSRQSKITTELVEIISGAAAADDSKAEEQ